MRAGRRPCSYTAGVALASHGTRVTQDKFDLTRYLGTLPLFSSITEAERARLAQDCHLRRLERGRVIFHVGDPCREFHVVVMGQVKLFAMSPTGVEKVIHLCGPGRSFGEGVMFMGAPYLVTAQTLTDTLLLTIERAAVMREIERNSEFSLHMLAGLARRLQGLVQDVEAYTLHSGTQRVIGYLLGGRSVPEPGSASMTVTLPVSKAAIASRLSITPEYFSRVLGELAAQGLIEVDKREIHIADVGKLAVYQER